MKKTLISLLATITLGIVATSCVGDSHKDTIMTAQPVMYCRAVNADGTDVHFTTSTYVVTLNYTKNTIAFEGAAGVDKSSSVYIITDDMPLTFDSSGAYNAYKFACATFKDNNGKEISNLHGWFDGNTGLAFLTFDAEDKHFYATPMIGFPYCTTTSVPEDQATSPYIAEEASFYCTLNKEKMTATILFANLHLSSVLAINA
ncbi:MAG: hypothetical protein IK092_03380, partial [Muribaculaceae bacterium]|nr:hypothetical protein [Muribaculaceae bacterium]